MGLKESINKCHAIGCPSACCRNQFISMNEEQFSIFSQGFSQKIEQVDKDTLMALSILVMMKKTFSREGVFDTQDIHPTTGRPHHFIVVIGLCPHSSDELGCDIYDSRPDGCRKLLFAGSQCADHRQILQLEPLSEESVPSNLHTAHDNKHIPPDMSLSLPQQSV